MKVLQHYFFLVSIIILILFFTTGCRKVYSEKENIYSESDVKSEEHLYFYYDQLSAKEKEAYDEILNGVLRFQSKIEVHISEENKLNKIYQAILNDHPEVFWCDNDYTYHRKKIVTISYTIVPKYFFTKEEAKQKRKRIEAVAFDCLSGISEQASDYEKILYVYRYIIESTDYDTDAIENNQICEDQNIDSVFLKKRSVCAGYARTMQYLLNKLGIFCTCVDGTSIQTGEPHKWNLIKCEGDFCYIDPTWGDPVFLGQETMDISEAVKINYNYFCCNDNQLFATHALDEEYGFQIPKCTNIDWNYYVRSGQYYNSYDSQKIWDDIKKDIIAQKETSIFKFSDHRFYQKAKEKILNEYAQKGMHLIRQRYHKEKIECYHMKQEEENLIQIYWKY